MIPNSRDSETLTSETNPEGGLKCLEFYERDLDWKNRSLPAIGDQFTLFCLPRDQRTWASCVRNLWVARNSVFLIVPSVVFSIPATVRSLMPW